MAAINLDEIVKAATGGKDTSSNSSVTISSGESARTKSSSGDVARV